MDRREFLAATAGGMALAATASAADERLRVAVIGHTGRGNYGHEVDTAWLHLPQTQIVAVADADAKGLASAQQRLKCSQGFADYRKMLAECPADIVAICPRYVDEHAEMTLAAVAAGARGIYMEKPFCRTPAEADRLVNACAEKKVQLALAHRMRHHPVTPVLVRMVEQGAIGRLLEIRGRGKEDSRGGALDLWVLGSHVLNLAVCFAGKPKSCSAVLLQEGRPVVRSDVQDGAEGVGPIAGDEVHARYETERGVPLFFESVRGAGVKAASFGMQIIGSQGLIDVRFDQETIAHVVPGNPFQPTKEARPWIPISTAGPGKPEPQERVYPNFRQHRDAILDLLAALAENRAALCGAEDGRLTVEMIAAVFESHRQGGRRVEWPLEFRDHPFTRL